MSFLCIFVHCKRNSVAMPHTGHKGQDAAKPAVVGAEKAAAD
jgi:hypothetical protein